MFGTYNNDLKLLRKNQKHEMCCFIFLPIVKMFFDSRVTNYYSFLGLVPVF